MRVRSDPVEQRILNYSREARLTLFRSVAVAFFSVVCITVQAYLLGEIVDRVFLKKQTLTVVLPWLGIFLFLILARSVLIWYFDVLVQRSANQLKSSLRAKLSLQIFALGPVYSMRERSGELVNTVVEGVEALDEYFTAFLPARFLAGVVPFFILLVTLFLDPVTTVILIVTGAILILQLVLIGNRAREMTDRRFLELGWMSAFFLDMLQGLATLKMFGRSREQIDNIARISKSFANTTLEILRTAFQTSLVLEWGGTIATALVAVQISLRLMNDLLPFNRALAVLIITPEFFLPFRQLALKFHSGTAGKAAAARIFRIIDTKPLKPRLNPTRYSPPDRFDIQYHNVSFAYEDGKRPALSNFSMEISHGQKTALVGVTGAGKTTAANLLLRFFDPDAGLITVNGSPLDEYDSAVWRAQVAWVSQNPHLFYGTLADNIRIAKPDASQAEFDRAVRLANAEEFIQRLPQGCDTWIGEQGVRLSGGQQQQVAIARAFLKDSPLLILDEATSHLDSISEAEIQASLNNLMKDRTVLIIAHRLKLVYKADRVAVMDRGAVIQTGSPDILLNQDGPYQQIVAAYESGLT